MASTWMLLAAERKGPWAGVSTSRWWFWSPETAHRPRGRTLTPRRDGCPLLGGLALWQHQSHRRLWGGGGR